MRSSVWALTSASGQAWRTSFKDSASSDVYLITAGMICLPAMSIMVLASILMAFT